MTLFVAAAKSISLDLGGDEDNSDKLSCKYSVALLVVFCVVISTKQYVGEPIVCWVPATYTASMRDYTDNMCWIKNTYYIPVGEVIPNRDEDIRASAVLNYYQWVPIFLVIQALMFYFPSLVWQTLNQRAGCDLKGACKILTDPSVLNKDVRERSVGFVTAHIDKFVESKRGRPNRSGPRRCCSYFCVTHRYGNYMILLFVFVKILYISNVIGQLFLLNSFVGRGYQNYGIQVLQDLVAGKDTGESERFPRSTLCSFKVREFGGNVHRHTVQCVLPINLFNEKIYVFLWFWFVFVSFVSVVNFFSWIWYFASNVRLSFCKDLLKAHGIEFGGAGVAEAKLNGNARKIRSQPLACKEEAAVEAVDYGRPLRDTKLLEIFSNHYLRADGIFILRLLRINVNEIFVSEITAALFKIFEKRYDETCSDDEHTA